MTNIDKKQKNVGWTVFPAHWVNIIDILIFLLVLVAEDQPQKSFFLWEGKIALNQNS